MSFTEPLKAKTYCRGYFKDSPDVLRAMDWVFKNHNGLRKDGTTPEWFHMLSVMMYLMTLERVFKFSNANIYDLYVTALLHDSKEDKGLSISSIRADFGQTVAGDVERLSKKAPGEPTKSKGDYYWAIGKSPLASLVKPADRIHNVQTMPGVFDEEKMASYVLEVHDYVLPMMKEARKRFPENRAAYENLKHVLLSQSALVRYFLDSRLFGNNLPAAHVGTNVIVG
jgi:(p)ppGpp synthase/HD superfamily hydrolase